MFFDHQIMQRSTCFYLLLSLCYLCSVAQNGTIDSLNTSVVTVSSSGTMDFTTIDEGKYLFVNCLPIQDCTFLSLFSPSVSRRSKSVHSPCLSWNLYHIYSNSLPLLISDSHDHSRTLEFILGSIRKCDFELYKHYSSF